MHSLDRFNLVKDWYFCSSLGISIHSTNFYLSALSVIDNPETTTKYKSIAYEQIREIENAWLQIYSIPVIIRSFTTKYDEAFAPSKSDRDIMFQFYEDLLSRLIEDEDVARSFSSILEVAFENEEIRPIQIISLAKSIDSDLTTSLDNPYENLLSFIPITVLFQILSHFCKHQKSFSGDLQSQSDIKELVENALAGNFDRLALLNAAVIARDILDLSSKEVLEKLWYLQGPRAEFEPDILYVIGILRFVQSEAEKPEQILKEFAVPNFLMNRLPIHFYHGSNGEKLKRSKELLKVFGITGDEDKKERMMRILPFLLWQEQLFWIIVEHFPTHAPLLEDHLIPKDWRKMGKAYLKVRGTYQHRERLKKQAFFHFESFCIHNKIDISPAKILSPDRNGEDLEENGLRIGIDNYNQWFITSPWFNLRKHSDPKVFKDINRYLDYKNASMLIRISGFAVSVIKLKQIQRPAHEINNPQHFLRFLAHTKSVFYQFNQWTIRFSDLKQSVAEHINPYAQLPAALTGLVKTTDGILNLPACGYYTSLQPINFINDFNSRFESGSNTKISDFDKYLYPLSLLIWLSEALPGAANSGTLNSQWISQIETLVNAFLRTDKDEKRLIEAILLLRLLCPERFDHKRKEIDDLPLEQRKSLSSKLYWTKDQETNKLKLAHRKLMLFPLNTTRNLLKTWHQECSSWSSLTEKAKGNKNAHLIIKCIEILELIPMDDTTNEIVELMSALERVAHPRDMDRMIRLRMLSFLNHDGFHSPTAPEGNNEWHLLGIKIIHRLLEFGGSYEIQRLLEKMFIFSSDGFLERDQKYFKFHQVILSYLFRLSHQMNSESLVYKEPKRSWDQHQKKELVSRMLYKISYANWLSKQPTRNNQHQLFNNYFDLGDLFRDWKKSLLNKNQIYPKRISLYGRLEEMVSEIDSTKQIIYDRERQESCLFQFNYKPIREQYLPGQIVSDEEDGEVYIQGIGRLNYTQKEPLVLFDKVQYKQNCEEGQKNVKQREFLGQEFKLFHFPILKSDISEQLFVSDEKSRMLMNSDEYKALMDLWFPNLYLFSQQNDSLIYETLAKLNANGHWEPYYFYLDYILYLDSILKYQISYNEIFTFTLIEGKAKISASRSEKYWVFSAIPGVNIKVFESDLNFDLEKVLQEDYQGDASGLMISFRIVFIRTESENENIGLNLNSLKLDLVQDGTTLAHPVFKELHLPFDNRNVQWRYYFEKNKHGHKALYMDGRYGIKVSVDHFPSWVSTSLDSNEAEDEIFIRIHPHSWDPREKTIKVSKVEKVGLHKIDGSYYPWFGKGLIKSVFSVSENDDSRANIGKNVIEVYTKEGVTVETGIDSVCLNLIPVHEKNWNFYLKNRKILISRIKEENPVTINLNSGKENWKREGVIVEKVLSGTIVVAWESDKELIIESISFGNNHPLWREINPGDLIFLDSNRSEFQYIKRRFFGRVLWEINHAKSGSWKHVIILGKDYGEQSFGNYLAVSSDDPGIIIKLKSEDDLLPLEGGYISQGRFQTDRSKFHELNRWTCPILSRVFRHDITFRLNYASSKFSNRKVLFGTLKGDSKHHPQDPLHTVLGDIQNHIQFHGDSVDFYRVFKMKPSDSLNVDEVENISERVQIYINSIKKILDVPHKNFEGNTSGELKNLSVSFRSMPKMLPKWEDEDTWRDLRNWENKTAVHYDHLPYIQSVPESYDENETRFKLISDGGKYYASFRDVKPITLVHHLPYENIRDENGRMRGSIVSKPLYFVRFIKEGEDILMKFRIKQDSEQGHYCLFEYGFGQTLLIPVEDIFMKWKEPAGIGRLRNVLFCGDCLENCTIIHSNQNKHNSGRSALLIPPTFKITRSQEFKLYEQSRFENRVHISRINTITGEINKIKQQDKKGRPSFFNNTRVKLSKESLEVLRELKLESDIVSLPAVLNVAAFEKTNGEEVIFDLIKYSFLKDKSGIKTIEEDSFLMYLEAQEIGQIGTNDFYIGVEPIEVPAALIGKEFQDLRILRRQFSGDIHLLKRLYHRDKEFFKGQMLLARVYRPKSGDHPLVSLIDYDLQSKRMNIHPPKRSGSVLASMARSSKESQTYVILLVSIKSQPDYRNKNSQLRHELIVEYHPGLYFQLNAKNWKMSSELKPGDVLRVEAGVSDTDQNILHRASFGEYRYFPEGEKRPVILFPKNPLWKNVKERSDWRSLLLKQNNFTIGSFSSLEVDTQKNKQVPSIMNQRHPKMALVARNKDKYIIFPDSVYDNKLIGFLLEDGFKVVVSWADGSHTRNADWMKLSFSETSISEILKTFKRNWFYGDKHTGTWSNLSAFNKYPRVEEIEVKPANVNTDPLVFRGSKELPVLRYYSSGTNIYPHHDLLEYLNQLGGSDVFTIAGVRLSADSVSDSNGLLIEFVPGRILEVPTEIIVLKSRQTEINMSQFSWNMISQGDRVKLAITDDWGFQKLILQEWLPSSRAQLKGFSVCSIEEDSVLEEGGVRFGFGVFSLDLPYIGDLNHSSLYRLDEKRNDLNVFDSEWKNGDTLWLSVDGQNKIVAKNFDRSFEVLLKPIQHTNHESLESWYAELLDQNIIEREKTLIRIIQLCGNGLPFTLEESDQLSKTLTISRRNQSLSKPAQIQKNRFCIAQLLGIINDKDALVRIGNQLDKVQIENVLIGVYQQSVNNIISKINEPLNLYLHLDSNSVLSHGISSVNDRGNRTGVLYKKIDFPEDDIQGLIFRDNLNQKLYFSYIEQVSWTESTFNSKIISCFRGGEWVELSLSTNEKGIESCSLVGSDWASASFDNIEIGDQIEVEVKSGLIKMNPTDELSHLIVRHRESGVYCSARFYGKKKPDSNYIQVEVLEKLSEPRPILVLQAGERKYRLDTATRISNNRIFQIFATPSEFSYEDLQDEEEILVFFYAKSDRGQSTRNELLDKALTWWSVHKNDPELSFFIAVILIYILISEYKQNPDETLSELIQEAGNKLRRRAIRSFHQERSLKTTPRIERILNRPDKNSGNASALLESSQFLLLKATLEANILMQNQEERSISEGYLAMIGQLDEPLHDCESLKTYALFNWLELIQKDELHEDAIQILDQKLLQLIDRTAHDGLINGSDFFLLSDLLEYSN